MEEFKELIAELKAIKEGLVKAKEEQKANPNAELEAKLETLKADFEEKARLLNEGLNEVKKVPQPRQERKASLADAIKSVLTSSEFEADRKSGLFKKGYKDYEIKADTGDITDDETRTQAVTFDYFPKNGKLAFIGSGITTGVVAEGKSYIHWPEGVYTSNVGYASEGTGNSTADTMAVAWKRRAMAKISAQMPITEELFEDAPQLATRLQAEMQTKSMKFADVEVLVGDGNDSTAPNEIYGITSQATAFAAGDLSAFYLAPNVRDVAAAAKVQAATNASEFVADTVWVNPVTVEKNRGKKDTLGNYIINPEGPATIAGLRVIETNAVDADEMLVADIACIELWVKRGMTLRIGKNGNDLVNDQQTAVLFMRAQCLVQGNKKGGVIWVESIADAQTELTQTT